MNISIIDNVDPSNQSKVVPVKIVSEDIEEKYVDLFKNIQGNILKGHGREFGKHIFIKFSEGKEAQVKEWIRAKVKITSAWDQHNQAKERKHNRRDRGYSPKDPVFLKGIDNISFFNFFLSGNGYKFLNLRPPGNEDLHEHFTDGIKIAGEDLRDPDPKTWEEGFQKTADALIIIANSVQGELEREEQTLRNDIKGIAEILVSEKGIMHYKDNDRSKPLEHFGYVDGISQPLFIKDDEKVEGAGGSNKWDPYAPLNLVLVKEGSKKNGYGSFLVFRKLEQNVLEFYRQTDALANKLHAFPIEAATLVFGRKKTGTPLFTGDKSNTPIKSPNLFNNFNYQNDPNATVCPFHAHSRRANPRNPVPHEREHQIVRRGMSYGERRLGFIDRPRTGVGLLFMCFQSNIRNQFEYLQMLANGLDPNNPNENPSEPLDPVIGQCFKEEILPPQRWQFKGRVKEHVFVNKSIKHDPTLNDIHVANDSQGRNIVTLKGGEYFFAPSISFLRNLSEEPPRRLMTEVLTNDLEKTGWANR